MGVGSKLGLGGGEVVASWGEKAKSNEQLWPGVGHGGERALNPGGRRVEDGDQGY